MTTEELDRATRDLDREFIADTFGPLTPDDRALWRRAKRKRGRPRQGKGVRVVSVGIEKDLRAKSDAAARKLKISRSKLISAGLRRVLTDLKASRPRKSKGGKAA